MEQKILNTPIFIPKIGLPKVNLEYPAFAGKPASSKNNWVPADFINYQVARIIGVADEKSNPS